MAISFARLEFIQRSKGKSSVIAAAYRSGSKLKDERTGELANYSFREDVIFQEILLPKDAGQRFLDRSFLWNYAESFESRKDAQIAYDIVLALPNDNQATQEDWLIMTKLFVEKHVTSRGYVADLAIHIPHEKYEGEGAKIGDDSFDKSNPHAHILVTTRRVVGSSFERDKPHKNWKKTQVGKFVAEDILFDKKWGDLWAEYQNSYFKEKGYSVTVKPKKYLSDLNTKKGRKLSAIEENQSRAGLVRETIEANPESLIKHLTHHSGLGIFKKKDLLYLIHNYFDDHEKIESIYARAKSCDQIFGIGVNEYGEELFVSKDFLTISNHCVELIDNLKSKKRHSVSRVTVERILKESTATQEQKSAIRHIARGKDLVVLQGMAGAGKSYSLGLANTIWRESGLRVLGVSLSAKAADELKNSSLIESSTIASMLYKIQNGSEQITSKDVLVIDEAGMVDTATMTELLLLVATAKAKIVLVGDTQQLQPIGFGAPMRDAMERAGFFEMTEVQRQKSDWQRKSTVDFARGRSKKALNRYIEHGHIHTHKTENAAFEAFVDDYMKRYVYSPQEVLGLAFTRKEVYQLNSLIRTKLVSSGAVGEGAEFLLETNDGLKRLNVGINDRVVALKNDASLGIKNNFFGTVLGIKGQFIQVKFDSMPDAVWIDTKENNALMHGYVSTIHKSQGTTKNNVVVFADKYWNRHLAYVAMSRHRDSATLHTTLSISQLERTFRRSALKDSLLDFPINFARRMGLSEESIFKGFIQQARAFASEKAANLLKHLFGLEQDDSNRSAMSSSEEKAQGLMKDFSEQLIKVDSDSVLMRRVASAKLGKLAVSLEEFGKQSEEISRYARIYRSKEQYKQKLVNGATDIKDTLAQRYLEQFGIQLEFASNIKYSPKTWNPDTRKMEPALITISASGGSVRAAYLKEEGGKVIKTAEKCFGPEPCSVVKVQEGKPGGKLFFAENIEIALTLSQLNKNITIVAANKDMRDFAGITAGVDSVVLVTQGASGASIRDAYHNLAKHTKKVHLAKVDHLLTSAQEWQSHLKERVSQARNLVIKSKEAELER